MRQHTATREAAFAFARERATRDSEPMRVFVRWSNPPTYYVRPFGEEWPEGAELIHEQAPDYAEDPDEVAPCLVCGEPKPNREACPTCQEAEKEAQA